MNNKTYKFSNKNFPITIIITANSFEEAKEELFETVKSNYGWKYDDFDDEDEF